MTADVAESGSSEQSVTHGMAKAVSIRMAKQAKLEWYLDSAQNQLSSLDKSMDVMTNANFEHCLQEMRSA